jgi:hypothetical protein
MLGVNNQQTVEPFLYNKNRIYRMLFTEYEKVT